MAPARQQHVAGLAAKEGDTFRRRDRAPHHRAGRAVDAACQIHGNDRRAARVHGRDHLRRLPGDRAIETGAEQRIDDDARAFEDARGGRLERAAEPVRRLRGIAFELGPVADQREPHGKSALRQQAAGDKPVAAVVARPGDDGDGAARRRPRGGGIGHGPAGVLHQRDTGNPARDREAIGFRHLGVGQKLDHRGSISRVTMGQGPRSFKWLACSLGDAGTPLVNYSAICLFIGQRPAG